MNSLQIKEVSKIYHSNLKAVDKFSVEFNPGMYGLLGPNGAGKSTLFKILATIISPDEGQIFYNGDNIYQEIINYKKVLGFMPQEFGFYPNFNAVKLLNHFAILKGIKKSVVRKDMIEKVLEQTNLWSERNKKISQFSGGMVRRLGVAQSLLGYPEILLLDEPTAGLDPEERNRFHNLLKKISKDTIMLISSHLVEDLSNLCSKILILQKGELKAQGSIDSLKRNFEGYLWKTYINEDDNLNLPKEVKLISEKVYNNHKYAIVYHSSKPGAQFEPVDPTLEEIYFSYLKDVQK